MFYNTRIQLFLYKETVFNDNLNYFIYLFSSN